MRYSFHHYHISIRFFISVENIFKMPSIDHRNLRLAIEEVKSSFQVPITSFQCLKGNLLTGAGNGHELLHLVAVSSPQLIHLGSESVRGRRRGGEGAARGLGFRGEASALALGSLSSSPTFITTSKSTKSKEKITFVQKEREKITTTTQNYVGVGEAAVLMNMNLLLAMLFAFSPRAAK